jgi:hypothetical protein
VIDPARAGRVVGRRSPPVPPPVDDAYLMETPAMDRPFEPTEVPLTRIEVLDFVGEAFDQGPPDREALIATAARDGAREVLLALLRRLPEGSFNQPADLWPHLPDVPVDLHTS